MTSSRVFYVGRPKEVGHHAAPLREYLPVEIIDVDEVRKLAKPGDLAIFFSEHFDRFRDAIHGLKAQQVATLYQVDGILEWRNAWMNRPDEPACPFTMRPVLADKVACIGASQARVLEHWGNRDKVEIVGIPRFDVLVNSKPSSADPNRIRLLIATAKVPAFTAEQMQRTKQSLLDLKSWIEQEQRTRRLFPNRELKVQWRLTAGLDAELQIENCMKDSTGSELASQLRQADVLISTPSTAILEGALLGLPVASLDYHDCPSYVPTAWNITHAGAIPMVLSELADPPAPKMFFQRMLLLDTLLLPKSPNSEESATARTVSLIQKMQAIAKQQLESGQPLRFPSQILEPPSSTTLEFDHRQLYPEYAEFRSGGDETTTASQLTITQVELAHARREIENLHRELSQCKSELRQAHAIFEQIHQHPVAGPIVRLRQKFLDWYSRNQSNGGK
jgi:hypothetical protein